METISRTLLLSQSYEPVKVISWQRAITLLTLGKVEVIEEFDGEVRSPSVVFKLPAVVRLVRTFKRFRKPAKFSRVNIYARDNYRCQYCGAKRLMEELTYDHVIPRSKGGKTVWTNIVTACAPCNEKKGDRTPEDANMALKRRPSQPRWVPAVSVHINSRRTVPDAWRCYLGLV
jgi:5-methylcytosine-specific restriction endonuclease McrA